MTGSDDRSGVLGNVGEGATAGDGSGTDGVVAGIVVAAGSGDRLGADVPKAFVDVAGATLLQRAMSALRAAGIDDLVAVVPDGWQGPAGRLVGTGVAVVAGGATRTASVAAGLAALAPATTIVAVHDAARPLVPSAVVAAAVRAVATQSGKGSGSRDVVGAAPGLPVGDTLKRVDADDVVVDTVDRCELVAIQTPQVFDRDVLVRAHDRAARSNDAATDDLALVESLVADGVVTGRVVVTDGSPMAMKVTRPDDLVVAEALARHVDRAAGGSADPAIETTDDAGLAGREG